MNRSLATIVTSAAVTLGVAGAASAAIIEVGRAPTSKSGPSGAPSCPSSPCLAVSRTTGYNAKVGTTRSPEVVPADGRIVAWSITLAAPTPKQVSYFDANEGGPASAGIAILQPQRRLFYRLLASSPIESLAPYFGSTVQFPLTTTIPVKKGDVIALTVPTWAPSLALGYGTDTSWRASRSKAQCTKTNAQTAQQTIGGRLQYYCLYKTARLTYSATLITDPKPTTSGATTTTSTTSTRTSSRGRTRSRKPVTTTVTTTTSRRT